MFSNTVAPSIVAASIAVLDILESSTKLRDILEENTLYFRKKITALGFDIKEGVHPIVPVMIYDAVKAKEFADLLLKKGVYVISFSYPVVPKEKARIRVQINASHSKEEIDFALSAFESAAKELKII